MALTLVAGPMDSHRDMNRSRRGGGRGAQKSAPAPKDSNDYVARIVRSTRELSENIKYISYVIAYSAGGSNEKKSKATGFSARKSSSFSTAGGKRTNSSRSSDVATMSPTSIPAGDSFQGREPLYPVNFDGTLRDAYVRGLVERALEERNREEGWHRGRLTEWFGCHLARQISHGRAIRNYHAHFLAAVDLHKRMSLDKRINHRDGITKEEDADDLWRDVVDALNHQIAYGKSAFKHIAGDPQSSLEDFVTEWDRVLMVEKWEKLKLPMFQSPTASR